MRRPVLSNPRQPRHPPFLARHDSRHIAAAVLRSPPSHRCKPKQHSGNLDLTRWWPIPLASRDCTTFLPNWRHHSEARSRWRQIRAAALLSTQAASLNVAARLVPHSSATDVGNKGATLCHYQRRPNRRRLLVVDLGQRRLLVLNRGAPTHAQGSKTLQIY